MWKPCNISLKGILAGIGFSVVASLLFGGIVGFLYAFALGAETDPMIMSEAEFNAALASSTGVQITALVGGFFIVILMGIIAEACAPEPALINAGICGGLSLLATFVWYYQEPGSAPLWSQVSSMLGVLPAAILGGWLICSLKGT